MSEQATDTAEKEYTEAELKVMRDNMIKYYKEELKLLKPQEEFERLQADVAEHKARRMFNMIKLAQMQAPPVEEDEEFEEEPQPKEKRTLKTD